MKKLTNIELTINDIVGALKGKVDFEHLRKKTKEVRERISQSMEERHVRLRQLRANKKRL